MKYTKRQTVRRMLERAGLPQMGDLFLVQVKPRQEIGEHTGGQFEIVLHGESCERPDCESVGIFFWVDGFVHPMTRFMGAVASWKEFLIICRAIDQRIQPAICSGGNRAASSRRDYRASRWNFSDLLFKKKRSFK